MRKPPRPAAPAPLLDWQPPLAREVGRRRRPILLATAFGLALMGLSTGLLRNEQTSPRLVWNVSASAPIGLWHIHPNAPLRAGDMVLAHTPSSVRKLAADRHYIPANVPLLKRIAAQTGDAVCALGNHIFVNGDPVATRLRHDRAGRPLPWWEGCERLRGGRLLLLMERPDSFDGRYFGPVGRAAIIGKATPLWLR